MFSAWCGPAFCSIMSIDLLGTIDNKLEVISAVIRDACLMDVEADGISFKAEIALVKLKEIILNSSFGKDAHMAGFYHEDRVDQIIEAVKRDHCRC